MEDIMVICKKCGNRAPASAMKLDYDEKLTICPDCVKNKSIHKEIEAEVLHKKQDEQEKIEEEMPKKVAHKCNSCNYKFMINPETKVPRNCPYCNARVLSF